LPSRWNAANRSLTVAAPIVCLAAHWASLNGGRGFARGQSTSMAAARTQKAPTPAREPAALGFAWAETADVLGHSVLVFVFLPLLVALPEFVSYEIRNPYNYSDPVVLALLPGRALRALVNAFAAGVIPSSISGALYAASLCAWAWARPLPSTLGSRLAVGALLGLLAGLLSVVAVVAIQFGREGVTNAPWIAIAFETGSAAVCGAVAAPAALRMVAAGQARAATGSGR